MKTVSIYLNFPGNTEEAFNFYRSVFGGEFLNVTRYREMGDQMGASEANLDKIANIGLPLAPNVTLMATDALEGWQPLNIGNNVSITLETDTDEEADRLFSELSAGGTVQMPLEPTEWAEKYGAFVDRYGVQWMVMYTGAVQFQRPAASGTAAGQ